MTPVRTRYFEFFPIADDALLEEAFQIRYHVYCEERGFLDPSDYPDGRESDAFDRYAIHVIGRHRFEGMAAATTRLVPPSQLGFPLARHCRLEPSMAFLTMTDAPQARGFAEISRVAVSKRFRRRAGDHPLWGGPPRDTEGEAAQASSPAEAGSELFAGLYKCIYLESKRRGLTHWIAAMERSLFNMVCRMGHLYEPIGPMVDYYGPVRPYVASIRHLEQNLRQHHPSVYRYWTEDSGVAAAPRANS